MGLPLHKMTLAEFLAWDETQAGRHEFFRGEVFAMVGGTRGHARVIANLMRHIGNHLEGSACQVFSEALRVVVDDEAAFYPDVFVSCDRQFSANEKASTTPVLVIEVLSPSTESFDRGKKFGMYRRLSTLQEYVLIDPNSRRVEVYTVHRDGTCLFEDQTEEGRLRLSSIALDLPLKKVFAGMDPSEEAPAAST
ncbi:Uma2 family endonuclease [Aquabacterium sp. A7-Y]|uniref:Uma2 family endonuclease n=1 Tax=Aquabacterium sp. A7-Y TaxID=1349605 RepID=UPI00223DF7C4|nr:Uma2 family endonuclease [Aquabacterium sp. A7-Y]MCW7541580.1 Uma2 family endonuclease [Aquabacterium sp. A7-Y]